MTLQHLRSSPVIVIRFRQHSVHGRPQMPNKTSILTSDPPRVQPVMIVQPSIQKSEHALGQA